MSSHRAAGLASDAVDEHGELVLSAWAPEVVEAIGEALSAQETMRLRAALLSPPDVTSVRVNTLVCTVDEVMTHLAAEHGIPREEMRVHETLENVVLIPVHGPHPVEELEGDNVVLVDDKCGQAVLRGADVFAPGVVACKRRLRVGERVVLRADILRTHRRGTLHFAPLTTPHLTVGVGTATMDHAAIFGGGACSGVAIRVHAGVYRTPALSGVLPDRLFLQNVPSLAAVAALGAVPGERVLDMCAAPGGKTTAIALAMRDRGEVVAVDKSKRKVGVVRALCERFALTCVRAVKADSTKLLRRTGDATFAAGSFDRVLLDAPCSGLGLRPTLAYTASAVDLAHYHDYQRAFLRQAAQLVRVGGTLVYSTCSVHPAENEGNVAFLLAHAPGMELVAAPPAAQLGAPSRSPLLTPAQRQLVQCFDPVTRSDVPGFFFAVLRRRE